MIKDNQEELATICAISFVSFWIAALMTRFILGKYSRILVDRNPESSAKYYLTADNDEQWKMVQSYVSTIFAVLTAIYCGLTIFSCDPPASTLTNQTLLGETLFRN